MKARTLLTGALVGAAMWAAAIGLLWVCIRAAGTDWAIGVVAVCVFAIFSADRLTAWRHRPDLVRPSRATRPDNSDWFKDAA